MSSFRTRAGLALAVLCLPSQLIAQTPKAPSGELDAFMEKVLARREVNRQMLQQYVLDETEAFEVLGPGRRPLYRQKRDFRWYVRDGLHVRSPVRFDGVTVGDDERRRYEEDWARRERERLARRKEGKGKDDKPRDPEPVEAPAGATPIPTPRFVSEAYFMDFKFEPGNYYLAGRERLDGHEVLRIEYYPERMFGERGVDDRHEPKKPSKDDHGRDREAEDRINRQMNKTALVTLWVDPAEHQIVKYTFDNVWMDFLPGAWLVRVDEIGASMTMGQPFPGIWLPHDMSIRGGVTLASGSFDALYTREFSEYRQADVTTKITVPKESEEPPAHDEPVAFEAIRGPAVAPSEPEDHLSSEGDRQAQTTGSAPNTGSSGEPEPSEVVAEVRVHGNAFLSDDQVIQLAGVGVGQRLDAAGLEQIRGRLRGSGRFESVDVRKRYRSLTNTTDLVIVLIVHERPGVTAATPDIAPAARPWHRLKSRLMFLPIVTYADGYGLTYGGRVSTIGLMGIGERLSVPLTWGGTRRAAIEVARTFERGPITSVETSFGIRQRENPRFEIDDQRVEWTARAERHLGRAVRAGIETSRSAVDFGALDDRLWTLGTDVAFDTRGDPAFPRNAVLLEGGWTGLHVRGADRRINRYTAEARGYLGVIGQAVLAGRVLYAAADRTLPPYERLLLGGSSTLRGFRTGAFDGDRMVATSLEVRVPITSVLSSAKLGVTGFVDAATTYDFSQRLEDASWRRGIGGGVFLIAPLVRLNLDVARGLKTGDTRVHVSMGFGF